MGNVIQNVSVNTFFDLIKKADPNRFNCTAASDLNHLCIKPHLLDRLKELLESVLKKYSYFDSCDAGATVTGENSSRITITCSPNDNSGDSLAFRLKKTVGQRLEAIMLINESKEPGATFKFEPGLILHLGCSINNSTLMNCHGYTGHPLMERHHYNLEVSNNEDCLETLSANYSFLFEDSCNKGSHGLDIFLESIPRDKTVRPSYPSSSTPKTEPAKPQSSNPNVAPPSTPSAEPVNPNDPSFSTSSIRWKNVAKAAAALGALGALGCLAYKKAGPGKKELKNVVRT